MTKREARPAGLESSRRGGIVAHVRPLRLTELAIESARRLG
jgi:hypothetical protein